MKCVKLQVTPSHIGVCFFNWIPYYSWHFCFSISRSLSGSDLAAKKQKGKSTARVGSSVANYTPQCLLVGG